MRRAKLRLNDLESLLGRAHEGQERVLLFLHSDAVEQLIAIDLEAGAPLRELISHPDVDVACCSAVWQRRGEGTVPAGVVASSLVQFWSQWLRCWNSRSSILSEGQMIRIEIKEARDARDWSETLEVILSAATLDLSLQVAFSAGAWRSLCEQSASRAAWQQLLDFDLASVHVHDQAGQAPEVEAGVHFSGRPLEGRREALPVLAL